MHYSAKVRQMNWTTDINTYVRMQNYITMYGPQSKIGLYAQTQMKQIRARWPGKEHLFD